MVFQDYALFPHLDVLGNVAFGIRDHDTEARRKRAFEVIEQVGMRRFADAYPHTLSGGQQQRVALARALAPKPRLLLLDEPFSGLDARLRAQIRDETLNVVRETGTSTVIVTHDPEEAMYMADRIALMNAGRIEQIGSPVELYTKPVSAFAAMFFSSINRFVGRVVDRQVSTPFGRVAASGLAEGQHVEVLIRPEALHVTRTAGSPAVGAARAEVLSVRTLRRATLLHLCCGDIDGTHVHARVPGRYDAAVGDQVDVAVDRSLAYVFPLDAASATSRKP
jgi:iron(III) transport system ATP-binding protein